MGSRAVQHPMRLTLPFLSRDAFDWQDDWSPRFNIAPMQPVPVIRQHPKDSVRLISALRWGLIPNWARDASIASGTKTRNPKLLPTSLLFAILCGFVGV